MGLNHLKKFPQNLTLAATELGEIGSFLTDKKIIETAWRKLYNKDMPFEIQSSGTELRNAK